MELFHISCGRYISNNNIYFLVFQGESSSAGPVYAIGLKEEKIANLDMLSLDADSINSRSASTIYQEEPTQSFNPAGGFSHEAKQVSDLLSEYVNK